MTKQVRKQAAEIIGFHLGWDINDVKDGVYQPSTYHSPRVYVCGEDYYCSPTAAQKLSKDFKWQEVGEHYGRKVYCATLESRKLD